MADKNKSVADTRRAGGAAARALKAVPPAGKAEPATEPAGRDQLTAFEAAIRLFHARRFAEAKAGFQQAANGVERDIAQRAQLHIAMCDRRLQQKPVSFGNAEECYNYGVALLNARSAGEACMHLEKALAIAPGSEHIHYALAAAQALRGDVNAALDNLRRAIELEPRNRQLARQDADFAALANLAAFRALLVPEKKAW